MEKQQIDGIWSHLHWLTVVAEQGNFTRAAARLDVSKASVSQRIAEIERLAGVPLVSRTTRSVRLTEAGQKLVDDLRRPFEEIAESFGRVQDLAATPRGLVRVTAPVAFARQQLVPRIRAFLDANPEVRLQLEVSDRLVSLSTEGFDLGIRHSTRVPDTHVSWTLCDTHSVIVASASYLKRYGVPQTPAELSRHRCLYYPRGFEMPTWSFEQPDGDRVSEARFTVPVIGPFATNNSESLRDAAIGGLGIALLPDFSVEDALNSGSLVRLLPEWRPVGAFSEKLYIIRPYAARVPRAVAAFVDYLRGVFARGFVAPGSDVVEIR
jgi:DNA-binding transcriptional LysR family regulator